ncbi:MAG: aspartyl/asparaginyl beta-hydroxylase domain-containing protein [Acidobacteriota bacterium]|nr:aspartyl/asparaginyl beta-hydroxylase domain-containing protein [Acidobacteriota bacterium]
MPATLKFPFSFDAELLQADAARFASDEWIYHFNTPIYQGDWSGIALRAVKGGKSPLYPDLNPSEDFVETEMMSRCRYVPEVLSDFRCALSSARFLKLGAGAQIRPHRDYRLGIEDGEIRIHIPVATNPRVEFVLDDKIVEMKEGEAWYLNFNLQHSVRNDGGSDRIHLVIDCVVNDWILSYFKAANADFRLAS